MTTPTTTSSTPDVAAQLELIEVRPGLRFSLGQLRTLLPDTETLLFFGKVYKLNAQQLGQLIWKVTESDLASALFNEGETHSNELQDYLLDIAEQVDPVRKGELKFDENAPPPQGEILPQVWESLEVEVAKSIAAVIEKLDGVLDKLPGKEGEMFFRTLAKMNRQRPTIGTYEAGIHHPLVTENLVILDVSGSMTENTVRRIIDDVVALSYKANAHLAIVSNTATHWEPGTYDTDTVLARAEYAGTRYEQLAPLLNEDWGTVITIADYDSSMMSLEYVQANCSGRIGMVLDVSLVDQPTWLARVVGQLADEVQPLLIGNTHNVLR